MSIKEQLINVLGNDTKILVSGLDFAILTSIVAHIGVAIVNNGKVEGVKIDNRVMTLQQLAERIGC